MPLPLLALGGVVGLTGLGGWLYYEHEHKLPLNVKPPPHPPIIANPAKDVPHTADVGPGAPMAPPVANPIKTPAGKPLVILTPKAPDGTPTLTATVATSGPAVASAHALYDYLTSKGYAGADAFVSAFQQAANADADSRRLHGPLTVSGKYDLPTSAALTIYTGLPFPPDPTAPQMTTLTAAAAQADPTKVDFSAPGPAAMSSSNLYAHLKMHGNVNGYGAKYENTDPTLTALVKQFQNDVNTDPKFPGPAYAYPKLAIVKKKLTPDGQYGPMSSDALAAVTFERIKA